MLWIEMVLVALFVREVASRVCEYRSGEITGWKLAWLVVRSIVGHVVVHALGVWFRWW